MNYIGGKGKLLPQLLPLFPRDIDLFVDLFCGGCNVGLNVDAKQVLLNDNLTYLIDLYQSFREISTQEILEHIHKRIVDLDLSQTNESGYRQLRTLYNSEKHPLDLFVLVAYSFNHQIRFNSAHQFNNPFGRNRSSFNHRMEENLYIFIERLKQRDIIFSRSNFDELNLDDLSPNDFVYCDPPYLITTSTYNDGKRGFTGWGKNEEDKLLGLLYQLHTRQIPFALSNVLYHKGKENKLLYEWTMDNGFYLHKLQYNYANASYNTHDRTKEASQEVLITNYKAK